MCLLMCTCVFVAAAPFMKRYESEIHSKCGAELAAGVSMAQTFDNAMVNW